MKEKPGPAKAASGFTFLIILW